MVLHVPEQYRIRHGAGPYNTTEADGNNGLFRVPVKGRKGSRELSVVVGDGAGWEHVSVSLPNRTPTWSEMCAIKRLFWDPEDVVVQYHPPESQAVNNHDHCLHLWRSTTQVMPIPASIMVGVR